MVYSFMNNFMCMVLNPGGVERLGYILGLLRMGDEEHLLPTPYRALPLDYGPVMICVWLHTFNKFNSSSL